MTENIAVCRIVLSEHYFMYSLFSAHPKTNKWNRRKRRQTYKPHRVSKASAFNPFTSESDQFSLSASSEILHQTSWRTWLFIAYSDERWLYNQLSLPHLYISPKRLWVCTFFSLGFSETVNPFTPKNDQFQISPAASLAILHHTVWRTWLFIAYSDERWFYYQFSLLHLYISL